MLDMKFLRENPDLVRENIKKKFQDEKLPLVDEVIELDAKNRAAITEASELRASRNALSKQIGMLMGQAKKDPSKLEEAEKIKATVKANADRLAELEKLEEEYEQKIHKIMLLIPNIIDPSVPIGPDDSCNVEVERFGEPKVPDFEIPYHTQIMESFDGVDMDAAGRVSGAGFYYLLGDIARLHEGVLAYARDFMIDKGFTFCIPPFMIHGNVVEGVMSQNDMDAMMYKIEGEDLYLIGTSEHSMVGRFIGEILPESSLPQTLTSYSPCFRKEKGSHGIEERGVYRIHQFEKQEMIVVCKPEDSMDWYNRMWKWSVELFRSMDIPVRQLECCSGDLGCDDFATLHDGFLKHPLPCGEVDAAGQHGDERHDDIIDERGRDLAERAADDDADGHIEHVAAHGKGLELFKKLLHGKHLFAENVRKTKTNRIK